MPRPKYKGPFGNPYGTLKKLHSDPDKEEMTRLKQMVLEKLKDPEACRKAANIIHSLIKNPPARK